MIDLTGFVDSVERIVENHRIGETRGYRRWNWDDPDKPRELGVNEYGCADAANILYTIGAFPTDLYERKSWVETLGGLQNSQTGMFEEATHNTIHTTAHCIAAMELFDSKPLYKLSSLAKYQDIAEMHKFLESLDWADTPWSQSHQGAGLFAAMVLSEEVTSEWRDAYFQWLFDRTDSVTGFFIQGKVYDPKESGYSALFPHLAGTFHYLFNIEYAKQALKYPEAMIDTCLKIFEERQLGFWNVVSFSAIDWVYCITRSLRQSGYKHKDCKQALSEFADLYIPYLLGLDIQRDEGLNDLHRLFGAMCCIAELQTALPGAIKTRKPLRLVLDRRPFI